MKMRALTIKQPWAWAIASGHKLVENRTWRVPYSGLLAIHAGKGWHSEGEPVMRSILLDLGIEERPGDDGAEGFGHVRGAVIAVARLSGICSGSTGSRFLRCECGPFASAGQFHWQLKDIRPLAEPFKCSGKQGLWEVDLPDHLIGAAA